MSRLSSCLDNLVAGYLAVCTISVTALFLVVAISPSISRGKTGKATDWIKELFGTGRKFFVGLMICLLKPDRPRLGGGRCFVFGFCMPEIQVCTE